MAKTTDLEVKLVKGVAIGAQKSKIVTAASNLSLVYLIADIH
jgi:hypothetical protein